MRYLLLTAALILPFRTPADVGPLSIVRAPAQSPSACAQTFGLAPLSSAISQQVEQFLQGELKKVIDPKFASRIRLHTDAGGRPIKTKKAVLILHGLSKSPEDMIAQEALAYESGSNVINLRLPGHYETDRRALDRVKAETWIESVHAMKKLAEQLGDDILIIGHSTGGLLAVEVATQDPNKIAGLFLLAPALEVSGSVQNKANWSARVGLSGWTLELGKNPSPESVYKSAWAGRQVLRLSALVRSMRSGEDQQADAFQAAIQRISAMDIAIIDTEIDRTIVPETNELFVSGVSASENLGNKSRSWVLIPKAQRFSHGAMASRSKTATYQKFILPTLREYLGAPPAPAENP